MIPIKSSGQIQAMRASGQLLAQVLDAVAAAAKPGVTTLELDAMAEALFREAGGDPAFLGYNGFPFSICASVNEEVVHGFPSARKLEAGDLLSIDAGVKLEGMITDSARTIAIGQITQEQQTLMDVTRACFYKGVEMAVPGNRVGDISAAIERHANAYGLGVVRALCGHGVGEKLHEEPEVPNYGPPGRGVRLQSGMTLAIEPMITLGTWQVKTLDNDWTVVTLDGKAAAHYEHTVLITPDGPQLLTRPDERSRP